MRLINTDTLELSEFFEPQVPPYAILSHTWEKDELTLREWTEPSTATTSKAGYKKVCMAASLSRRHGFAWLWVDTVCIDKTSSAELSEAINSMFNWYGGAHICYAFLADVSKDSLAEAADDAPENDAEVRLNLSQFRRSRWFTRGWTLQELIAPLNLIFYSREWAHLGSKESFASDICSITGIDEDYLWPTDVSRSMFPASPFSASVATRMSWLAKRQTTRIEDMAYCMLGIFDINMPLLYGEGYKAFLRLQEEIIRVNDDQSIFVWNSTSAAGIASDGFVPMDGTIGFLAPTPRAFERAQPAVPVRLTAFPSPYTMTNAGLSITLPLIPTLNGYIGMLSASGPTGRHGSVGVFLCMDSLGQMSRMVYPGWPLDICLHPSRFDRKCVYVRVVDRRPRDLLNRPMCIPPSRKDVGLVVSLRKNMERDVPDFYSFPAECLRQAPESVATLVFPQDDGVSGFVAVNEASDVRAVTSAVILRATPLKPDAPTKSGSFCLLLVQTTIRNLKTQQRHHRYAVWELEGFPHHSRSQWLPFAGSEETKKSVSKAVRERNDLIISSYIQAQWQTNPSSAMRDLASYDLEYGCYEHVEFGCCDMGHPDFDQLRLIHIGWPPEVAASAASATSAANTTTRSLFRRKK